MNNQDVMLINKNKDAECTMFDATIPLGTFQKKKKHMCKRPEKKDEKRCSGNASLCGISHQTAAILQMESSDN